MKCTLISTISPAQEAFLESLSTLKFANRAKNIKNEARVNEDLDEKALLRRYERELKKLRQELQAKSRNVVDKRKLIEVEEQRRRAEQDKMTALMNMERLSRDLLTEKNQKKKLEERIKEMNSQLLVGGLHGGAANGSAGAGAQDASATAAENQKAFQQALQVEQERIRQQYTLKLAELEKERESMEEEKAQTSRYKQLLLKQRDIMIQLTARLNERDQSILLLQEELDAYDKHQRAMEDELDQKRHRLIQLQRMNVGEDGQPLSAGGSSGDPSSPTHHTSSSLSSASGGGQQATNLYGLFPIDEAPYFEENSLSPNTSPGGRPGSAVGAQQQQDASGGLSSIPFNPSPSPSPAALGPELEAELQRRVQMEVHRREQASGLPSVVQVQAQMAELSDALQRKESETLRLREELDRARRSPGGAVGMSSPDMQALAAQNAQLMQTVASLQQRLQTNGGEAQRDELASLKRKYDVQLQERAALKVILEKKMKALIDSIANAALHGQSKTPSNGAGGVQGSPTSPAPSQALKDALPSRTKREIEVLQRLVEASLTALKNSDEPTEPQVTMTQGQGGAPRSLTFAPAPSATVAASAMSPADAPQQGASMDGIEMLIAQRKAELLRLDERQR